MKKVVGFMAIHRNRSGKLRKSPDKTFLANLGHEGRTTTKGERQKVQGINQE
jgi:hypothetical protein